MICLFTLINSNTSLAASKSLIRYEIENISNIYLASMDYIFDSQNLINRKGGSKSSLFGDEFIVKVKKSYSQKFQKPFPDLSNIRYRVLVQVMVEVMEENKTLILDPDIEFKGFIPVVYAFQLSQKFLNKGLGIKLKFTNLTERIRNKFNVPNKWEVKAMNRIVGSDITYFFEYDEKESTARYITKVPISKMCLTCHGFPKDNPTNKGIPKRQWTNIDKTGFIMEHWTLKDFGGAVSVTLAKIKYSEYND
jgi:hypothetical protein